MGDPAEAGPFARRVRLPEACAAAAAYPCARYPFPQALDPGKAPPAGNPWEPLANTGA